MAINLTCECGKRFSAKDEYYGRRGMCPVCKREFVVGVPIAVPEMVEPPGSWGVVGAGPRLEVGSEPPAMTVGGGRRLPLARAAVFSGRSTIPATAAGRRVLGRIDVALVVKIGNGQEPIVDVEPVGRIEPAIRSSKPRRYQFYEIRADPLPSDHTSRGWGVAVKRSGGTIDRKPDPLPS